MSNIYDYIYTIIKDTIAYKTHIYKSHRRSGTIEIEDSKIQLLYQEALSLWYKHPLYNKPDQKNNLCASKLRVIFEEYEMLGVPVSEQLKSLIVETFIKFIEREPSLFEPPTEPVLVSQSSFDEQDKIIKSLNVYIKHNQDIESTLSHWFSDLANTIVVILKELELPPIKSDTVNYLNLSTSILSLARDPESLVDLCVASVSSPSADNDMYYQSVKRHLFYNFYEFIGHDNKNLNVLTVMQKNPTEETAKALLYGTPFETLLMSDIETIIPRDTFFEHTHILAGSGHGKTQTIQSLILKHIADVIENNATIVVIDSQGDLIHNISNLNIFTHLLKDKITIIEPKDIEYPVALNLFDVNIERLNSYAPLIREQTINGIIELYEFIFDSLLGAEMTSKQGTLFRYITRLMITIPDSNISTLVELMKPDGYDKYYPYIQKLEGRAKDFFETEFNGKEFQRTKSEVLRRLWTALENQTFDRMFSHKRNKLDMFKEMNEGRVILISTAKDLLKERGSQILGRFFIAMIHQVALERASIPAHKRMPTYVYIDECADYVNETITLILAQARKYNIGLILSHQYLGQLDPKLQQAIASNTAIKLVGGVSNKDARSMASEMGVSAEFIQNMKKGEFATYVRGITPHALTSQTIFGLMEDFPKMSPEERQALQQAMRDTYAVHITELLPENIVDSSEDTTTDDDIVDTTKPSQNWWNMS